MTTLLHWRNVTNSLHYLKSKNHLLNRRINVQKSCSRYNNSNKPGPPIPIPVEQVPAKNLRPVGWWLAGCSGMVFGTVILGGITRSTEMGMVIWHRFKETRPPLSQVDWETEFVKYQQLPKNKEMTLAEFKMAWWIEYLHRTSALTIGAAFFAPGAFFWLKGYFKQSLKSRVGLMGGFLGIQGLLGWYMAKSSGTKDDQGTTRHRVGQYQMAAHLGVAFILFSMLVRRSLFILVPPKMGVSSKPIHKLWVLANFSKGFALLTAVSGAFVAGISAGLVYNSFPKMGDQWIPEDILAMQPVRINFSENPATVQFNHRVMAITTFGIISYTWLKSRPLPLTPRQRLTVNGLMVMGMTQFGIGIATLLFYVPQYLASIHQSGSLVLLSIAIWATNELKVKKLKKV